jgi:hypothetical protein
VLPYPTIKPLLVALFMIVMFSGLIIAHWVILVGAALMVLFLYGWLTSPLEPEHH